MAPNKENTFIMHPLKMKAKARTLRARAGLIFPGHRIYRKLKSGFYAPRIAKDAAIFVAAVLEYLAIEILELAGNAAAQNRKKRISPRHILLAIRNDDELNRMLKDVIILQGGVIPHIEPQLLPKKIVIQKHTSTNDSDTFSQEY